MADTCFTPTILKWFTTHARELPWRGITDPYRIWVSEVILQQTRIDQGRDYWYRFIEQFPTVEALAAASEDDVLRQWQGLGYYSRARNMHAAARQIVELGHFPDTYEQLKQLKGVGDYTAAAIASLAFGEPVATVDGNVYRVLARYYGLDTPINTTQGKHLFQQLAQSLLPIDQPAAFNQAMMDFGATCCMPRNPHCDACPLAVSCDALRNATVDKLPVKNKNVKITTRHFSYVLVCCNGMVAMRRREAGDIWQGLWEPLLIEGDAPLPDLGCPARLVASGVRHVLTHRVIIADFYCAFPDVYPALPKGYKWIKRTQLTHYALPRLVERLFEMVE